MRTITLPRELYIRNEEHFEINADEHGIPMEYSIDDIAETIYDATTGYTFENLEGHRHYNAITEIAGMRIAIGFQIATDFRGNRYTEILTIISEAEMRRDFARGHTDRFAIQFA